MGVMTLKHNGDAPGIFFAQKLDRGHARETDLKLNGGIDSVTS